jgi:UDP-N-acetylglucosamine acyltransferase
MPSNEPIHRLAEVDPRAELGEGVTVGPFAVIGQDVRVGAGTTIGPHAVIEPHTEIGSRCVIGAGALLGGSPQDHKFRGERSYLRIGDRNTIREYCTLHRAVGEGEATILGNDNLVMAYSHIGHNCEIGSHCMITNNAGLSGHVILADRVVIGGMVGIHQYVRVGRLAMIGGISKVVQDVPPFMMADGRPAEVVNINVVGLRRSGLPPATRSGLRQAYKLIYRSNLNLSQAIEAVEVDVEPSPERDYLLDFLRVMRGGFGGRGNDPNRRSK